MLGQALGKGWPRFARTSLGLKGLKTAFSAWVSLGPGSVSSDAGLRACEWADLLDLGRKQAKPGAGSRFCFEVWGK